MLGKQSDVGAGASKGSYVGLCFVRAKKLGLRTNILKRAEKMIAVMRRHWVGIPKIFNFKGRLLSKIGCWWWFWIRGVGRSGKWST